MVNLVPRSFFDFPRFPSVWEDEEDGWGISPASSGLSVSEDDKHVYVEAAVPGVDPKNIEITYDKGVLWIKGEQQMEDKDEKSGAAGSGPARKYYRRAASSFSYRLAVPGEVDANKEPEATCKNGIMKVVFEKRPEVQPKKISVKTE